MINLQIFISKRGTRVVRATDLYRALALPAAQYAVNMRKWLKGIYEFQDGLRKPQSMRDFARRKKGDPLVEDYYLTLEFAKLLCLRSGSKHTLKCARYLDAHLRNTGSAHRRVLREMQVLLNLLKEMRKLSNQQACERRHAALYKKRNGGKMHGWWAYREKLFSGKDKEKWAGQVTASGRAAGAYASRALLLARDPAELIRRGVADWLLAQGKHPDYALGMAGLAKEMALLLGVKVENDLPRYEQYSLFSQIHPATTAREEQSAYAQPEVRA